AIDSFLKSNAVSDEFEGDRVILTSVAFERKYLLGGIVDQANEILDTIESYHDYYFPYAQHDKNLWKDVEDTSIEYPQLPSLIETNELQKEELATPDQKQIDDNLKKIIQSFIKIILPQLSIDDRLEFLILLQLLLKTAVESSDEKSEILQLKLLATDDHLHPLSESVLKNDQQWKAWYDNLKLNSFSNLDKQQFSPIEKLLIIRLLCPEHYINALSQYAKRQYDVVITKDASVYLIYLDARLHHYDCLLEEKVSLSNLLYQNLECYIREIISQLISHSSSVLNQCQDDELTTVYGLILIQQIFQQSSFTLQWTKFSTNYFKHNLN
ncbi:unnamed protein product, partial [Adineta steineri]